MNDDTITLNYADFRARFVASKKARLVAEESLYPKSQATNVQRPSERSAFALVSLIPQSDGTPPRFVLSGTERRLLYYDKQFIRDTRCSCGGKPKPLYQMEKDKLVRSMGKDPSICICFDVYTSERLRYLSDRALVPVYQVVSLLDQISATFARAEMVGVEVEYEYTAMRVYRAKNRERRVA